MKRFYFICLVTLLSICAYAQQNKAYKIDFSICDCSIEQADGICSIVPTTSDFHIFKIGKDIKKSEHYHRLTLLI